MVFSLLFAFHFYIYTQFHHLKKNLLSISRNSSLSYNLMVKWGASNRWGGVRNKRTQDKTHARYTHWQERKNKRIRTKKLNKRELLSLMLQWWIFSYDPRGRRQGKKYNMLSWWNLQSISTKQKSSACFPYFWIFILLKKNNKQFNILSRYFYHRWKTLVYQNRGEENKQKRENICLHIQEEPNKLKRERIEPPGK